MEFFKLLLPLFLAPKNYYDVRQRLAMFVFYEVFFSSFIFRSIRSVREWSDAVETAITPEIIKQTAPWLPQINPIGIIFAAIVAVLFFIFHMHDRMSDVFKIRKNFDRKYILIPLANLVSAPLNDVQKERADKSHDKIMRQVFYKYSSSRVSFLLVYKHDIEQALESWSWFWVGVEGTLVAIVGLILSVFVKMRFGVEFFSIYFILALLLMCLIRPYLRRRAQAQIETIAGDPTARNEVNGIFSAL